MLEYTLEHYTILLFGNIPILYIRPHTRRDLCQCYSTGSARLEDGVGVKIFYAVPE